MVNNSSDPDQNMAAGGAPFTNEEMIAWCVGFGIIDALIIIGNTLAIIVFTRTKLLRKRTNYFLLCLAIADIMVGLISLPMFIHILVVYTQGGSKTLNKLVTQVPTALDIFTGFASVFALTIISLERLYSVALPNWHRTTPSYVYCILLTIIWTMAGVLLSFRIFRDEDTISENTMLYVTIITFCICMVVICLAYIGIWIKVVKRMHEKTKKTLEKDKRLAMTLFLVTAIFVMTWMPFQGMNVYISLSDVCDMSCTKEILVLVYLTKLMQYANSFINPIIYTFKMPDFRRVLLSLLGRRSYGASTRATSRMLTDKRKRASTLRSSEYEANGNCENAV